jgi:RimJ/RimL family protein N-acetyltransferase
MKAGGVVLETPRLTLRLMTLEDASFILSLLNEPSFHRYIGDKGVRDLDGARRYIVDGPMRSYERFGFGLWVVTLRDGATPIGMCGLLKRDSLEDPDIGFAYLPAFWGKGYAHEAAEAVMTYGRRVLKLARIVAVTNPDNDASANVLRKVGLRFDRMIAMPDQEGESRFFVPQ